MQVFYTDLSYESIEETESYPKQEMINELAGITGLYFGFSLVSLASYFRTLIDKFRSLSSQEATDNLKLSSK